MRKIIVSVLIVFLGFAVCVAEKEKVIEKEEMDSLDGWEPTNAELVSFESKNGVAVISCDPAGGQERWGGIAKDFSIDIGAKTFIEVKVDSIEPKGENWYMHLSTGSGQYVRVQNDTGKTGIFRYRLGKEWKTETGDMTDLTGEGGFRLIIGVTGNRGSLKKVYVDYIRILEGDLKEGWEPATELKVEGTKMKEEKKTGGAETEAKISGAEAVSIDLTSDDALTKKYLGDGWWFPEPDARWTGKGKKPAEVLIPVEEGYEYSVIFAIAVVPVEKISGTYTARILVNGEEVKTLSADELSGSLEFLIPEKYLKPGNIVRVGLETPLFCPKEIGESEDNRTLGLKIKEVAIVPAKKAKKIHTGVKKPVAILKDRLPVVGTASNPDYLAEILKAGGYECKFISSLELANPQIFDRENFDVVILPYGASFPAGARDNFLRFLRKGGSFVSMGGYAFDNLCGLEQEEKIIANPGFEDGMDGWFSERMGKAEVTIEEVSDVKHSGKSSCYIKVEEGAGLNWYNAHYDFTGIEPRTNLSGSAYIKTREVREGAGAYLAFNFYKEDGSRISWVDGGFVSGTSEWVYRSIEGVVPPGTARISFTILLYGFGEAWFDDVKVERISPGINTHKGKAADFLEIKPEQVGVFDAGYLLEHVKYAGSNRNQYIISSDIRIDAEMKGYAAIGVLGDNWYCGAKDRARWTPLLFGYDRYGRNRGAIGAIMHNFRGIYKGSIWVYFGVDNIDLFSPRYPGMCKALLDILKSIERGIFLHETQSEYALYKDGEEVSISTRVSNFGSLPQEVEVKIELTSLDGDKIYFEDFRSMKVEPGESEKVLFSWKPEKFADDIYRIKAFLNQGGKTIDLEDFNGFVVWNEKVVKSAPKFTLKDNYFRIGERPVFLIGAQEFWASNSLRNSSPVTIALDYRTMHDFGLRFSRSFMMWATRPPEVEKRFRDMMVYLCQKYGVVMFFEGISDYSPDPKVLEKGIARAKEIGERYKGIPLFAIDLRNEPSLKPADVPEQNRLLKEFVKKKYGGDAPYGSAKVRDLKDSWGDLLSCDINMCLLNFMRDWARNLADEIHKADPERLVSVGYLQGGSDAWNIRDAVWPEKGLDFMNRHFYGPLPNFPPEFKEMDMRYQNKPPSTGEFGSKTHPGGGWNFETKEEQYNRYLFISHYALGLGGGFVSNWHWRDPWENIFAYGIMHQDLVPKDVLKVYRNSGLLFATIQPQYEPPSVYYLLPDNHRISYTGLRQALYNGLNQLMDCHLDFGVINEDNISKLPREAKVIIYPVPFMPDDSVYEKLKEFVSGGGILYFSGDISYGPVKIERTNTYRLEELAGVKFVEENYSGIPKGLKPEVQIKPAGEKIGLREYTGFPCIKVKPLTAKVVAESGEGPVAFVNNLGKGKVFYTADPIELNNPALSSSGIYKVFLSFAGIKTNSIMPDNPGIHIFKVKTSDGNAYVLYNRNTAGIKPAIVTLTGELNPVSISLSPFKPGFVHIDKDGNILGVESQGEVKQGEKIIMKTDVHTIVFSLDSRAIDKSDAVVIMTMYPGSVTLLRQEREGFSAELGEICSGKWVTLENIKPASVSEGLKIDIDEDRALEIILLAKDLEFARKKLLSIAGF